MKKIIYLGLDVHKESISIAYTTSLNRSKPIYFDQCGGSNLARMIGVPFKELHVCYPCPARTRAPRQGVA